MVVLRNFLRLAVYINSIVYGYSTCMHHCLTSNFVTKRLTSLWCMQVLNPSKLFYVNEIHWILYKLSLYLMYCTLNSYLMYKCSTIIINNLWNTHFYKNNLSFNMSLVMDLEEVIVVVMGVTFSVMVRSTKLQFVLNIKRSNSGVITYHLIC